MNAVTKYFTGEKIQCSIGIAFSLISIGIALYFFLKSDKPFYIGMAYPFIIIATLLLIICVGVVLRSSNDIVRVNAFYALDPNRIKTEELPRMQTVLRNFKIVIWAEIAFIVAGAALFFLMPSSSRWQGVGMGLIIQAAALLLFDIIANSRGKIYFDFLQGPGV